MFDYACLAEDDLLVDGPVLSAKGGYLYAQGVVNLFAELLLQRDGEVEVCHNRRGLFRDRQIYKKKFVIFAFVRFSMNCTYFYEH